MVQATSPVADTHQVCSESASVELRDLEVNKLSADEEDFTVLSPLSTSSDRPLLSVTLNDIRTIVSPRSHSETTKSITDDENSAQEAFLARGVDWSWNLQAIASVFFAAVSIISLCATICSVVAIPVGIVVTVTSLLASAGCFFKPQNQSAGEARSNPNVTVKMDISPLHSAI